MTADMQSMVQAVGGGALIGLASWLLLASLGKVAGISGIAASALVPDGSAARAEGAWRWAFLVGLILGGAVGGAMATQWLHPAVTALRPLWVLILAGLLVGVGTVLGAGCTSGHGVCGLGRRSLRSLVATLAFMGSGVATVFFIFTLLGRAAL